ncbi:MAG: MFS transporter, partial [Caldilineaceae bacterium SB0668_bin_21]|nr:MFS transporter [Caldilineaceae bacterium SB0668_bin_21]
MSRSHDPYAAFRIHDYRLYVIGWVVARMGTYIQSIAIAWEIYQRTGEALSLGLVGLAQALPLMVLALPAGLLADRYERRRLSIFSLLGMTVTSLALAAFSIREGPVLWMYALLFLDACMMTVGRPARTALLPQLVPAEVFPNAVTWNMSLMHIASVVGPALGGIVVAVSVQSAYFVAAAGSMWLAFVLTRIQFRPVDEKPEPANWQTLLGGIRFVWDKRILFTIMALDLFAVLLGGAVYLLPIFAEDILNVGATGFGYLRAAPAVG